MKHPAPISCREVHTVFPLKNKTNAPENSMDAGTNATSPLSKVTLIAFVAQRICRSIPWPSFGFVKYNVARSPTLKPL